MKVAFLITAYHQPAHLARLIKALDRTWATFYVHIDAKKDIAPFIAALGFELTGNPRINFLTGASRIRCYWGGFGLVQATLNLMREAANSGFNFSRFCLLTGSDYPIKSPEYIHKILNSSSVEYLSVDRKVEPKQKISHWDRRAYYYHFRNSQLLMRSRLNGLIPRLRSSPIPIYLGSGWWCLTRDAILFALEFIRKNPTYLAYLRYVDIPDEVFIHSIIKASPFSSNLSDDFENPPSHDPQHSDFVFGAHYINWSQGGSHPKVLDELDRTSLISSRALFARKFEFPFSEQLICSLESASRSDC